MVTCTVVHTKYGEEMVPVLSTGTVALTIDVPAPAEMPSWVAVIADEVVVKEVDAASDDDDVATRLRELEGALHQSRLVLNEGAFFDVWGRNLKVEEAD